jgi:diguanylate cyclase (GGDEF)-like protein/PAS domain S-box-containing protein
MLGKPGLQQHQLRIRPLYRRRLGKKGEHQEEQGGTEEAQAAIEGVLQIRLRFLEYAISHSLDEMLQKALDEVGELTGSPIGFYCFVDDNERTVFLQIWSTRTMQEYCHAEGKGAHYPIEKAGVWIDCVKSKQAVVHNDYAALPHKKGLPAGHAPLLRELTVPTIRDGQVVSILAVGNKPEEYTEQDVDQVNFLADVLWEIVSRKRAEQALIESEERYRAIVENCLMGVLIRRQGKTLFANQALGNIGGYTVDELMGMNDQELLLLVHPEDRADAFHLQQMLISGEIESAQREYRIFRKDRRLVWVDMLAKNIVYQGQQAQVSVYIDITDQKDNERLRQQMEEAVSQQNHLREQALRDPLTGLFNRRYLAEALPGLIAQSERNGEQVGFVMLDIDHFKVINDRFGHPVGDLFIEKIAEILRRVTRQSDFACRYGGEEFLLVLPGAGKKPAVLRAEEIRQTCEDVRIYHEGEELAVTVSLGVAVYPQHGAEDGEVIEKADQAMYLSKQGGRNQVRVWEEAPLPISGEYSQAQLAAADPAGANL